jgi:ferric-dicitrate binding protein FerR (iron transport regulator)
MDPSSTYDFPWELISSSFSGSLSKEEEFLLQQWLTSDPSHKEKYGQLQKIWSNGLEDYKLYLMANEAKAWDALQSKLLHYNDDNVINLKNRKTRRIIFQFAAAAAVLLLLIGVGYWYTTLKGNATTYETAFGEKKNIKLTDGTEIALSPVTRIEVSKGYDKKNRTVIMTSGEASFDVPHRDDLPFIVDLGKVDVKDIGTVFNIKKEKGLIKVTVISGTVAFTKQSTKETRELTAGMSLTYNIANDSFGEIQTDSPAPKINKELLNFNDTPLIDVIGLVQKKYGKTIHLEGDSIAHKKFTAHLDGIPYNTALEIICKSLNLKLTLKDSIYILREKADR